MTFAQPAVAARHPARFPARFTVEQFHRLIAAIQTVLAKDPSLPLQLRVESPLDLGPNTEPEPDLAFDLKTKARLYSGAGIPVHGASGETAAWLIELRESVARLLVNLPSG